MKNIVKLFVPALYKWLNNPNRTKGLQTLLRERERERERVIQINIEPTIK